MKLLLASLMVAWSTLLIVDQASARPRVAENCDSFNPVHPCVAPWATVEPEPHRRGHLRAARGQQKRLNGGQIVAHPAGCPRWAFCGCGAALRVFGEARRDLWLAAAWLRFPRAAPAPGMVAARSGHVFVLEHHVSGKVWMAYDANSGGRATRIHPRSIAGYSIVNPRA